MEKGRRDHSCCVLFLLICSFCYCLYQYYKRPETHGKPFQIMQYSPSQFCFYRFIDLYLCFACTHDTPRFPLFVCAQSGSLASSEQGSYEYAKKNLH